MGLSQSLDNLRGQQSVCYCLEIIHSTNIQAKSSPKCPSWSQPRICDRYKASITIYWLILLPVPFRGLCTLYSRLIQACSFRDWYPAAPQRTTESPHLYVPDSVCHFSAFSLSVICEAPNKINKVQTTTEDAAHSAEQHQLAVVHCSCAQGTLNFFHHLEVTTGASGQEHYGHRILRSTF